MHLSKTNRGICVFAILMHFIADLIFIASYHSAAATSGNKDNNIFFIIELIQGFVDEQYKSFDPNHERHFLDMYFKEMLNAKTKEQSTFCCEFHSTSNARQFAINFTVQFCLCLINLLQIISVFQFALICLYHR